MDGFKLLDGDALLDFVEVVAAGHNFGTWRIARRLRRATAVGQAKAGVVWLGGFRSDMLGAKASFIDSWAKRHGRGFLRFDYSGHGESSGRFEDGAIGDWLEQAVQLFEISTRGPQILVGSSMGAWIALLLARRLAEKNETPRLKALVLIAPAVDFTEALIWKKLKQKEKRAILETGGWPEPSLYSAEPTPITRRLIEEGRNHLLLDKVVRSYAPVHILQGMRDSDVPWRHASLLLERLVSDSATISYIRDGDHRLSREQDLAQIIAAIESFD